MKKRVLIVAREFPPFKIIGRIRTVKWCQHLPRLGWETAVLSMTADSHLQIDPATLREVPETTRVYRAPWPRPKERAVTILKRWIPKRGFSNEGMVPGLGKDAAAAAPAGQPSRKGFRLADLSGVFDEFVRSHLSIPDPFVTWAIPAVNAGLKAVRKFRPDVILATAPAFTDFVIGWQLSRRTGIPWVADYRDLWTGDVLREWVPAWRQRFEISLERRILRTASAVVSVSGPKTEYVRQRVPQLRADRFFTITNGYDLDEFEGLTPEYGASDGVFRIVYAGRLFKNRRGYELLEALGGLLAKKPEYRDKIRLEYYGGVAPEIEHRMNELIDRYGMHTNVRFFPDVSYKRSKALQLGAGALLMIVDTGKTTSGVIPGKLFEYIAARRPILCIAEQGATSEIIERGKLGWVVWPGDVSTLGKILGEMVSGAGFSFQPDENYLSRFDRRNLAADMDNVLRRAIQG